MGECRDETCLVRQLHNHLSNMGRDLYIAPLFVFKAKAMLLSASRHRHRMQAARDYP